MDPTQFTIEHAEMFQQEINRRARSLILRLQKMEFPDSTTPPEYDKGITYAAVFYAGMVLATQTMGCSTAVEIMARIFRRVETMTIDEVLASLEHDISMDKPTKGVM